ncbi:OmpA family protein [Streptomonospora nanhaiensis]|uniref:OmpA family protein n=1 Tax=Streptomonospora nanhaiensis TaxID=1323731 RepID=UPI001C38A077|nr:OmpA family protein [Streptomonospora nanhaiensis]MBV2365996.1 OmpA family protein [Streptomonospora nanhaiensis]
MSSRADAAAGAAGALFLFAAPPAVAFLGLPPAGAQVSPAEVLMHLRAFTLPTSMVLSGLAAVAALAWAAYAAATLADLVRLTRGQTPRLAVARLVAALLAALAASPTAHAATDEATAPAPALPQNQSDAPASTDAPGPADPIERHRSVEGFAVDSAHLTPDMRAALASTAELISTYGDPGSAITVTGHTDPTGPAAHNADLSQRRAQTAASYLQKAVGEGFTITAEGHGPAAPANGVQDYAAMRRVEVDYQLLPPSAPPQTPTPEKSEQPTPRAEQPAVEEHSALAATADPAATTMTVGTALAASLLGGYTLGRRTRRPARNAVEEETPEASSEPEDEASPREGENTGHDAPPPSPNGDSLRLTPDAAVNASAGVSITGPAAADLLTELITRLAAEAPGNVIATRAVLSALSIADHARPVGATVTPSLQAALVRAEARIIAAHRETDRPSPGDALPPPTIVVEAPGPDEDRERLHALLASDLDPKPTVIALGDLGCGVHVHAEADLLRITDPEGTVREVPSGLASDSSAPPAEEPSADALHTPAEHRGESVPMDGAEAVRESEPASGVPAEPPGDRVRLRLFAPRLGVQIGGTDVAEQMRSSARSLLALLAIRPSGATGEEIAELLAPEARPAQARAARNNALSSARAVIRSAVESPDLPVIEFHAGRYRLQPGLFTADLWDFNDAATAAKNSTGRTALPQRENAVSHYTHELLSDVSEPWVECERQRCRTTAAQLCVKLAHAHQGEAKTEWFERACAIDPYNEVVHRYLIEAHAETGDADAAHRAYQRLAQNLREIGERPGRQLREFVERLTSVTPLRATAAARAGHRSLR